MPAILIAAVGAAGAAGLLLGVLSWKHRAVLAGLCSSAVVALCVVAIGAHPSNRVAETLLILAGLALLIALALLTLGEVLWRLLADVSEDDPSR